MSVCFHRQLQDRPEILQNLLKDKRIVRCVWADLCFFFGLTSALHGLSVDTHAGLIAENSKSDYPPDRWVVLTNWKDVEAAFSPASDYITELLTHHTPSFVYLLFTVTTSEHMSEVF